MEEDVRIYSLEELKCFDGEVLSKIYLAFKGIVYDVTECMKWKTGIHEKQHFPGQDLSPEISEAPHGEEVFNYPCVKRVGILE